MKKRKFASSHLLLVRIIIDSGRGLCFSDPNDVVNKKKDRRKEPRAPLYFQIDAVVSSLIDCRRRRFDVMSCLLVALFSFFLFPPQQRHTQMRAPPQNLQTVNNHQTYPFVLPFLERGCERRRRLMIRFSFVRLERTLGHCLCRND